MTEKLEAASMALPRHATDRRDQISITGIGAVGYHGVFENERRVGQPFFVDVTLFSDCATAGRTDDLHDTIHYGEVAETIKEAIVGPPLNLIEALAERIVQNLFEKFGISAVEITVHKPKAPIEVTFADVAVTIYRENT
ncbi:MULTISPECIES: dihydroneopterin aldolase [Kocuria]|uniref:dihydroneopterin aldolase n=1 Tax=Kocuria TaxID=57493 RepID=UPI0006600360|nr:MULTISPECIES: dihydroneopterin aldolase [Kocuria]MCT1368467.1 dihydroneopterin aldolase [Rothia sp. p3-SID1597]